MELVRVPLLNANEDELTVVEVRVRPGQSVRAGEVLCVVESTKATLEVEAPRAGVVRACLAAEGARLRVGAVLMVLTDGPEDAYDLGTSGPSPVVPGGVDATRKARELALVHGVDVEEVARSGALSLVRERDVLEFVQVRGTALAQVPAPAVAAPVARLVAPPGAQRVVVLGAGGHGRVLIDLLREGRRDLFVEAVVDDAPDRPSHVFGVPVVGTSAMLAALCAEGIGLGVLGVGSVTNNALRIRLFERLRKAGLVVPNLIHPRAAVEPSVQMGQGNQIFAGAVVGSAVRLGDNTIVNSGAIVSHDCHIGSHAHITPGAILAGGVEVGENTVIGMGVTVYLDVRIGANAVIANGVHVMRDVPDGAVVRASLG